MAGMDLESGSKASSHGIRIFRVSHDVFMAMNHTRLGFVIYCMFLDLLGSHGTIAESADQSAADEVCGPAGSVASHESAWLHGAVGSVASGHQAGFLEAFSTTDLLGEPCAVNSQGVVARISDGEAGRIFSDLGLSSGSAVEVHSAASASVPTMFERLAKFWNTTVLRHGDRANTPTSQLRCHPNTYEIDGALRGAVREIGKGCASIQGQVDIHECRHKLEILTSVSALAKRLFDKASAYFKSILTSGESECKNTSLTVIRHHDATPILVKFGRLQDTLVANARYLKKLEPELGRPARWTTQSYADYRLEHPNSSPTMGVVQVLGQKARVCSITYDPANVMETAQTTVQHFISAPMAMADGKGTTTYDALETAFGTALKIDGMKEMSRHVDVLVVSDVPDNCNANRRQKAATEESFRDVPNLLYDMHAGCHGHKLHTLVTKTTREQKLAGHVHAVETVKRVHGRRESLLKAVYLLVDKELEIQPGPPPDEYVQHSSAIVEHTLLRQQNLVRSRRDLSAAKRGVNIASSVKPFLAIVNGDPRRPKCSHWCSGCCVDEHGVSSRQQAVVNFHAALVTVGIFGGMMDVMPATSRWHTCGNSLALQTAGILFFKILPRAWKLAFGETYVPRNLTHSDDYHLYVRNKTYRALLWLNSEDTPLKSAVDTVLTAFVDGLLMTLQHLEEQSLSLLLLLVSDSTDNPIVECMLKYHAILKDPLGSPIGFVLRHFKSMGFDVVHIAMVFVTSRCMSFMGQLWRFFYTFFRAYPYRLLSCVNDTSSEDDKKREISLLYDTLVCCIDESFTSKARSLGGTVGGFLKHAGLQAGLRNWGRNADITNMCCERLLSLVRKASPLHCFMERLLSAGFLTQVRQAHASAGGLDSFKLTRSQLLAGDAPIRAACSRRANQKLKIAKERDQKRRRQTISFKDWANRQQLEERQSLNQRKLGDRADYRQRMRRLAAVFKERKAEIQTQERFREEPMPVDDDSAYVAKIGTHLWGCSDRCSLLRTDLLLAECEAAAPSNRAWVGGLTARLGGLRSDFIKELIVPKGNTIADNKRFKVHIPCHLKHPGICKCEISKEILIVNRKTVPLPPLLLLLLPLLLHRPDLLTGQTC